MKSDRAFWLQELLEDSLPAEIASDEEPQYTLRIKGISIKNEKGYFEAHVTYRLYKYEPKETNPD